METPKNSFREIFQHVQLDVADMVKDLQCGLKPIHSSEVFLADLDKRLEWCIERIECDLVDILAPKLLELARANKLKGAEELAEWEEATANWILD